MDVPKRLQGGLCDNGCHHYFRRAKIAFDAGAPKIAQSRVSEGLSAINNCRVHEARRQEFAAIEEETHGEDAEEPTERAGACGLTAATPARPRPVLEFSRPVRTAVAGGARQGGSRTGGLSRGLAGRNRRRRRSAQAIEREGKVDAAFPSHPSRLPWSEAHPQQLSVRVRVAKTRQNKKAELFYESIGSESSRRSLPREVDQGGLLGDCYIQRSCAGGIGRHGDYVKDPRAVLRRPLD